MKYERGNTFPELARIFNQEFSNDKICEMDKAQKERYELLLNELDESHESSDKARKGRALEQLVEHLICYTNIFKITRNIRTHTNELDHLIALAPAGNYLYANGILGSIYGDIFISECKNHSTKIGVTYVGKFCSLLQTTQTRLGILFSYYGVTGTNWSAANGLIKKFYLSKESADQRYCVVNFTREEFGMILNGSNLLDIFNAKINALRIDCRYDVHLSGHPACAEVNKAKKI